MKYYYINKITKIVMYYNEQQNILPDGFEFLGKTNNPKPKMAVAHFLKNQSGYKIIIGQ